MITLRQLRYLHALARHGHFGRAADDCAVTQPALSMQVRELEKHLGIDLIERRPGEIALSDVGVEVARRAEQILTATRDLEDFARHGRSVLTGPLRLGVIPTVAPYVLPRILPHLPETYPDLRLELRETQTKALLAELMRGTLDAVLLALPAGEGEVETLPLFEDPFLLAVPAAEPLPRSARVTTADIDLSRLILLEEGHCLRDQALSYCASAPHDPAASLAATSLATVMQMVANGYGVTLVPQVAASVEVRDDRVRLIDFVAPAPGRTIGLAWRRTSPRKSDFLALGDIVKAAMEERAPVAPPRRRAQSAAKAPPPRRARRDSPGNNRPRPG